MDGLHLTADLYGCRCDPAWLRDEAQLARLCQQQVAAAGLTAVGERWVRFPGAGGVTGVVLLAESHLALHTWPEAGNATLDIYVCNFSGDNTGKAHGLLEALLALLQPQRVLRQQLQRGAMALEAGATAL
ncbi:MAG: adenosylmethionine decarboxylase [Comamonas sp.]